MTNLVVFEVLTQAGSMTLGRNQQVDLALTKYYLCVSRCVRRANLCGEDRYSGRNYNHRKDWIHSRIKLLSTAFAVDICSFAILDFEFQAVARVSSEVAAAWSDAEVVERYTRVFPSTREQLDRPGDRSTRELIATWRTRLSSLSWFFRALKEKVARLANREDQVSGRFWAGRFRTQPLVDTEGVLAGMVHVDLEPIREGVAGSTGSSAHTSAQERFGNSRQVAHHSRQVHRPWGAWLAPFSDCGSARDSRECEALPIGERDYLQILAWTARSIRLGSPQSSETAAPEVLRRHKMSQRGWLCLQRSNLSRWTALGAEEGLTRLAAAQDKKWIRGMAVARTLAATSCAGRRSRTF
jgi:hypothetical protein